MLERCLARMVFHPVFWHSGIWIWKSFLWPHDCWEAVSTPQCWITGQISSYTRCQAVTCDLVLKKKNRKSLTYCKSGREHKILSCLLGFLWSHALRYCQWKWMQISPQIETGAGNGRWGYSRFQQGLADGSIAWAHFSCFLRREGSAPPWS